MVLRAVPADVEPQNAESLLVEIANKLLKEMCIRDRPSTKARTVSFSSAPVMVRWRDIRPFGMIMEAAIFWL